MYINICWYIITFWCLKGYYHTYTCIWWRVKLSGSNTEAPIEVCQGWTLHNSFGDSESEKSPKCYVTWNISALPKQQVLPNQTKANKPGLTRSMRSCGLAELAVGGLAAGGCKQNEACGSFSYIYIFIYLFYMFFLSKYLAASLMILTCINSFLECHQH